MSKLKAMLITIFLGEFGIHRFMAGKVGTGILWLCTGGLFTVGWFIDVIMVISDRFKDSEGNPWVTK